jgi:hypothetical protein
MTTDMGTAMTIDMGTVFSWLLPSPDTLHYFSPRELVAVFRGGELSPRFPLSLSLFVFCKKRGLPKGGGGGGLPNKRTNRG